MSDEPSSGYECNLTPMCAARDMFGKTRCLPDWAYETMFQLPDEILDRVCDDGNRLTFQGSLNLAAKYVKFYLKGGAAAYHIMVRAVAVEGFKKCMKGKMWSTTFWCWCDGGKNPDPRFRQHLHMIVFVFDEAEFERAWKDIRKNIPSSRDFSDKVVVKKKIVSTLHFINALAYVSKRTSACSHSEDKRVRDNHFCIGTEIPTWSECLTTLEQDCLLRWLERRFRNYSLGDLHPVTFKMGNSWHLKVNQLPELEMNRVFPVEWGWKPVGDRETDAWMELCNGDRLYFEWDEEWTTIPFETWVERQGRAGNLFCMAIGRTLYRLSKTQQISRNDDRGRMEQFKRRLDDKDIEWQKSKRECRELRARCVALEARCDVLEEKFENQKMEICKDLEELKRRSEPSLGVLFVGMINKYST